MLLSTNHRCAGALCSCYTKQPCTLKPAASACLYMGQCQALHYSSQHLLLHTTPSCHGAMYPSPSPLIFMAWPPQRRLLFTKLAAGGRGRADEDGGSKGCTMDGVQVSPAPAELSMQERTSRRPSFLHKATQPTSLLQHTHTNQPRSPNLVVLE